MVSHLIDWGPRCFGVREGSSTNKCIHAFSFLLAKHRESQPSGAKLLLPIIPIGILARACVCCCGTTFAETTVLTWITANHIIVVLFHLRNRDTDTDSVRNIITQLTRRNYIQSWISRKKGRYTRRDWSLGTRPIPPGPQPVTGTSPNVWTSHFYHEI